MDEDRVKRLLRKHGLKVTSQRLLVLDIVASHPDAHLTAEEIHDLARENGPEIGLATIYRTVQVLTELHVINKVNFDDGLTRYELNEEDAAPRHRHHHAICRGCGKVYSLRADLLDALEKQVMESVGFLVTDHEVKLYGLCRECQAGARDNKNEKNENTERNKNDGGLLSEKCKNRKSGL